MNQIMKAIDTIAILCTLVLTAACGGNNKIDPVEPDSGKEEVKPETRSLTFVLPETGAKTAWVAGDRIIVHGEYAKDQVTVTLAAGDISADGKSATKTVEGLYPYKNEEVTSSLYASYPAETSDNLRHCFFYSRFNTTNAPLMAACDDNNRFQFENVCGLLTMDLEGDFDGYLLATPKKEALGYEFLQVQLTDKDRIFKQYVGDPVIQIEGALAGNRLQVFLPDGTDLKAGFTLKLAKDGKYVRIFRYTDPLKIQRGTTLDLGDITDAIEHYDDPFSSDILDLDTDGNANCYIVTQPGSYKFKAVFGNNSNQYVTDIAETSVLWETWNDTREVTPGSVVTSVSYAEDYIILHTPDPLQPGNAVVAAKAENGDVLWSWHIWVPASAIETGSYGGVLGNEMMDRNLGALVAAKAEAAVIDPLSYGFVYQWGRKDPFTGAAVAKSNTLATIAGAPDEVAPGQISLAQGIANPRLLGHINNGDWLLTADNTLWSDDEKTIYDPCPPGYRVPAGSASYLLFNNPSSQEGWEANTTYGWITIGSPKAVFPIAGYRDDYTVGEIAKVGVRAMYWSSHGINEATASGANLRTDGAYNFSGQNKSRLGSVRCVTE